jgi:ankyrin repeat protein
LKTKSISNETLLYIVCRSCFLDIIQILLQYGCDVNAIKNGSTALHAAAFYGHIRVISFLIASGASIDMRNCFDSLASEKAKTPEIQKMIEDCSSDPLTLFLQELAKEPNYVKVSDIYFGDG